MKNEAEYARQIKKMADNVNAWRAKNAEGGGEAAVVQFNYPPTVMVVATVRDAIQNHFVYANAPGLELLKAMFPWDSPDEPTVLMARIALEIADEMKAVLKKTQQHPPRWQINHEYNHV